MGEGAREVVSCLGGSVEPGNVSSENPPTPTQEAHEAIASESGTGTSRDQMWVRDWIRTAGDPCRGPRAWEREPRRRNACWWWCGVAWSVSVGWRGNRGAGPGIARKKRPDEGNEAWRTSPEMYQPSSPREGPKRLVMQTLSDKQTQPAQYKVRDEMAIVGNATTDTKSP